MTGSTYKDLLDPQIAARNRHLTANMTKNAHAHDLPERPRRFVASAINAQRSPSTRIEVVAAVGVVLTALLTVFVVLVLQAGPAASQPTAPGHSVTVVDGHGGGGTSFRIE